MNADQKKTVKEAIANAEVSNEGLGAAREVLQTAFDAMSETTQEGDKGGQLKEWIEALEEAEEAISGALDQLKTIGD